MALAIDSSTPAFINPGTASHTTQTTASFTPPLGALLVVLFTDAGVANGMSIAPSNTGGAVTWDGSAAVTKAQSTFCSAQIWRGVVTTSASMTVTATVSSAHTDWSFGVAVITGQAATQNGAIGSGGSASGLPTATTAALVGSSSIVAGAIANNTNATVGTPSGTQSLTFSSQTFSFSDATNGSAGWAQWITAGAAGGTQTINDTAPTIQYAEAVLEILASGAAPSLPPDLIMAPSHR